MPATMSRRMVLLSIGACALAPGGARAQQAGSAGVDSARRNMLAAAARGLKRSAASLRLEPPPGATNASLAALKTGELLAWRVLDGKGDIVLQGFSGPGADGPVAFEGYRPEGGGPGGLSALLRAARAMDGKASIPAGRLAQRLAFCLNRRKIGEFLFDAKVAQSSGIEPPGAVRAPFARAHKSGRQITYFTMVPGHTGTFQYWRINVIVQPGYRTIVQREPLRP
ncbi:MAG: hypothetical protein AB7F96_03205 [Beijerinckiaceae bacterium]